jgi:3-oxoacyl-[acyl-carrier-protein] synthase-3
MTINEYGSVGGPSIPLTITQGGLTRSSTASLKLLLLGYGVGLSWASALIDLPQSALLNHLELSGSS